MALSEFSHSLNLLGSAEFVAEDLESLGPALLQKRWRSVMGRPAPKSLSRQLMMRILAWREQIVRFGDIDATTQATLTAALRKEAKADGPVASEDALAPRPGSVLLREHGGVMHRVMVLDRGYVWNEQSYPSLSAVAGAITGTKWNGPRFFGLDRRATPEKRGGQANPAQTSPRQIQTASTFVEGRRRRGTGRADENENAGDGDGVERLEGNPP